MKSPVLAGVCAISLLCSVLALALAWQEPLLRPDPGPTADAQELALLRAQVTELQRRLEFALTVPATAAGERRNALALDAPAPTGTGPATDPRDYLASYVLSFADDGQGSEYYRLAVEAHAVPLCLPIAELVRDGHRPAALRRTLAAMLGKRRFAEVPDVIDALLAAVGPPAELELAQAALAALARIASPRAVPALQALVLQCSDPVRAQALTLLVELAADDANAILLQLFLQAQDDGLRQLLVRALTGADSRPALELLTTASGGEQPVRLAAARKVGEFDEPGFDALVERWRPHEQDAAVLAALGIAAAGNTAASWSPAKATGAPDADPRRDDPNAWAPKSPEMGLQWLQLTYPSAMRASAVRIFEVNATGAVVEVRARGADGIWFSLWRGPPIAGASPLVLTFPLTASPIRTIRLVLDTDRTLGWNEIDAVELVGPEGSMWATRATASSTFANDGGDTMQLRDDVKIFQGASRRR